jgi:hypothetical protein
VRVRIAPYLLLALLGLAFFANLVLHPTQTLYTPHSDLLSEHLPAKRFLVRSWQETGEVPLWCPFMFGGMPFIQDTQVGAFYPPHFLLYNLPESWLGAALSWLVLLHVIAAGWCMYTYAKTQGLGIIGAFAAGLGYMFAGKWLMHLVAGGHYGLIGLAWLPLVLLFLERALRRGSLLWATAAGAVFGCMVLGTHPQWMFYAGLFVGVWTLGPALDEAGFFQPHAARSWPRTATALGRWLGFGMWTALVAVGLAAVQVLPTLEAAPETSRAFIRPPGEGLGGSLRTLFSLLGPSLTDSSQTSYAWEYRSSIGLLWLAAAALAPILVRGRARFQFFVLLLLLLFGIAGEHFMNWPVFGLFRLPSRMTTVAGLPLALLVGTTTDVLCDRKEWTPVLRRRCGRTLVGVGLFAVLILVGEVGAQKWQDLRWHPYWSSLLITVPVLVWLTLRRAGLSGRWLPCTWVAVLLLDLWALPGPLVAVCSPDDIYQTSACVDYLATHREEPGRVLVRDLANQPANTPLGAELLMVDQIETLSGFSSLDLFRFKQYVQFISGSEALPRPGEWLVNFPVKNKALLDLLGVRYLLQPSDPDLCTHGDDPAAAASWQRVFEDPEPKAHLLIPGYVYGLQTYPPYSVYENKTVFPRAFVVAHAAELPRRGSVLRALKETDLQQTVLLADVDPENNDPPSSGHFRPALVTAYEPNHVQVNVEDGPGGWLVLADVWFPGWTCTIDGQPTKVYRADYLFRAVRLPDGAHEVDFTFAPSSYRWGRLISATVFFALMVLALVVGFGHLLRRRPPTPRRMDFQSVRLPEGRIGNPSYGPGPA